jgi:hypothetical protein
VGSGVELEVEPQFPSIQVSQHVHGVCSFHHTFESRLIIVPSISICIPKTSRGKTNLLKSLGKALQLIAPQSVIGKLRTSKSDIYRFGAHG